ncbi:MAG: putative system TPR-repeat lipoprotein [Noviherbaspirillum sp.]|jgi:predicted Zn-dependent protease|nr:putative system TPR-repeat lipoprotein [Noviherbaspirillum sp.]
MSDAMKSDHGMEHMLSGELARILAEAGFHAIARRRLKEARLIFETLRMFRPTRDFPIVGLALTAMESRDYKAATSLLKDGSRLAPDSAALQGLLALALMFEGKKIESAQLAQSVIGAGTESSAVRFAKELQKELARRTTPTAVQWNTGAVKPVPKPK